MVVTGKLYPTGLNASGTKIGAETPEGELLEELTEAKLLEDVFNANDELIAINK